jgi:hypothetical protein
MNAAGITHGPARDVADHLHAAEGVRLADCVGALVNALSRVDRLEKAVVGLTQSLGDLIERHAALEESFARHQGK